MRVHHIGIISKNMEDDIKLYERLGYVQKDSVVVDEVQFNRIVFVSLFNDTIELIEPIDERSSVYNLPAGYAHICYEVEDLDIFLKEFKNSRTGVIFTPKIVAPAFGGRHIVFAYLKNKTMVEFLEKESANEKKNLS